MGILPEDSVVRVSKIVKLWVAEGLIKSVESKVLEDVAEGYFLDLVDRNIVLVCQRSSRGKIKTWKIHDLLLDLCVREAQRQNFFHVNDSYLHGVSEGIILRRLSIRRREEVDHPTKNLPNFLLRSLLNFAWNSSVIKLLEGMLLKVFDDMDTIYHPTIMAEVVNMRYLACCYLDKWLPASIYNLRNLQTLIIYDTMTFICLGLKIWKMTRLMHV
ncbi:Hypothetical predicted protein [Olea europaea subsp. europaea]|uniref:Disease resistance protein winged helix domain-containing protein n=2 Tax=Olea europaea subsp. europaea TaxID=158383 RepID=A0A8S0R8D0_OLEEU|nr:Hypothetical predicted protein [Olea europaea subsp. europaea]